MVKKKKKPSKKRTSASKEQPEKKKTWVDKLDFSPFDGAANVDSAPSLKIRVVSWNCLAEAYCSRRSHRLLPKLYQNVVFSHTERRELIKRCLGRLADLSVDVLCLQEVDLVSEIDSELRNLGYREGIATPTTKGGGAGGRVDAVVIYCRSETWTVLDHQVIQLDDLATLGSKPQVESNLEGLKQSFLRRNVALVVRLQHRETKETLVVTNAHLHWNPAYEYVKLCQTHYVMLRTKEFAKKDEPVIFCGDLNSKPSTSVHAYLVDGRVNSKRVAPWYRDPGQDDETPVTLYDDVPMDGDDEVLSQYMAKLELNGTSSRPPADGFPKIRYLLDFTLNRFTRWLRILGVDAALESDEEEIERTKNGNILLFQKCLDEKRTLITTSSKLVLRKDCPAGTYLVNRKSLDNMEATLVHLLLTHGVVLEPCNFLSRCVVCNGNIVKVEGREEKRRIFAANSAPEHLENELDVWECVGCQQGYWWNDNPTSSASRVKSQATRLFELCLRGGVPISGELNMFDYVDVELERQKGLEDDNIELEHLEVTDWLKDEALANPFALQSAYALQDTKGNIVGETIPFTNVTHDFVGLLDYIFFDTGRLRETGRLHVPKSFNDLNTPELHNGHLLPSNIWPSDHLAIGAELVLQLKQVEGGDALEKEEKGKESTVTTVTDADTTIAELYCLPLDQGASISKAPPPVPTPHRPACACGCVPKILSLFEMAELRKQAREKARLEKQAKT